MRVDEEVGEGARSAEAIGRELDVFRLVIAGSLDGRRGVDAVGGSGDTFLSLSSPCVVGSVRLEHRQYLVCQV